MSTFVNAPPERGDLQPASRPAASREAGPSRLARFAGALPSVAVFALLAGVFYIGHRTDWSIPKYSDLFGTSARPSKDWCSEHLVPASLCVECKPELLARPTQYGFCRTHGVAECVLCHPDLAQIKGQPKLPGYDTAQALALVARRENNSQNKLHERRVQFASAAAADKVGIDVDVVHERPMKEAVSANGEILFDPSRVAHLSSRAGGTVALVFKQLGDPVAAGELLALVDAVQVGQAKSRLLQALVQSRARKIQHDRLQAAGVGVAAITVADAKAALEEAEVALISARQALVNLGLDVPEKFTQPDPEKIADELRFLGIPADIEGALPAGNRSANLIAIRSPHAGVIVAADIVPGEVVEPARVLFTVADPGRMWLTLHVRQQDARYVSLGQSVSFRSDDAAEQVSGHVAWISPDVDQRTRSVRVRVNLANPDGRLRDHTFGTGEIILRQQPHAVVVPRQAVQATTDATFVFVRDRNYLSAGAPKVFYPRQVRVGARDDAYVELLAGVLPGEVVATTGSSVLLAQLLRGSLGAACGCHEQ
jgi:cobalt-zinc-cadmium efflux system membrane fusion protein